MKFVVLRLAKFSAVSVIAFVGIIAGLGGLNLYTYQRFTEESRVASLDFVQRGERTFAVTLTPVDDVPQQFELRGDEWQLDVRMIKWNNWLTFLGEAPLYRLDRVSGRFISIDEARNERPQLVDLRQKKGIDVWSFARDAGDWLPGIDAAYGSSVYLPMRDGQSYDVWISNTGLLARKRINGSPG